MSSESGRGESDEEEVVHELIMSETGNKAVMIPSIRPGEPDECDCVLVGSDADLVVEEAVEC